MRLKSEQLLAVDLNRTRIGMRGAAECIEQCGLAGSVRSDDRLDNAARNVEIDTIQRDKATEPFGHATRGEDRAVAHRAMQRKTGARGLRSIMEIILLDTMFELPSLEGVEEVVISKQVVEGTAPPLYVYADRSGHIGDASA